MLDKIYIGIDNGVSGTIGIITPSENLFMKTPVKKEQNYQKTKKTNINRLDVMAISKVFAKYIEGRKCFAVIERPMINGTRFTASMSAARCLEALLISLELFEIPYQYTDSKLWQKELLPAGIKGTPDLKSASCDVGCRLFPEYRTLIQKHGDADGILIAEYARRYQL
jgi:hypothetical protein